MLVRRKYSGRPGVVARVLPIGRARMQVPEPQVGKALCTGAQGSEILNKT